MHIEEHTYPRVFAIQFTKLASLAEGTKNKIINYEKIKLKETRVSLYSIIVQSVSFIFF